MDVSVIFNPLTDQYFVDKMYARFRAGIIPGGQEDPPASNTGVARPPKL